MDRSVRAWSLQMEPHSTFVPPSPKGLDLAHMVSIENLSSMGYCRSDLSEDDNTLIEVLAASTLG